MVGALGTVPFPSPTSECSSSGGGGVCSRCLFWKEWRSSRCVGRGVSTPWFQKAGGNLQLQVCCCRFLSGPPGGGGEGVPRGRWLGPSLWESEALWSVRGQGQGQEGSPSPEAASPSLSCWLSWWTCGSHIPISRPGTPPENVAVSSMLFVLQEDPFKGQAQKRLLEFPSGTSKQLPIGLASETCSCRLPEALQEGAGYPVWAGFRKWETWS